MENENVLFDYERRAGQRYKVKTRVRIKSSKGRSKLCEAINLSAHGCAVRTDDLGLKKNEQVELAFVINLGKIQKMHHRLARVVHVTKGITGFSMMRKEN